MNERQKSIYWRKTDTTRRRFDRTYKRRWRDLLQELIEPVIKEITPADMDGLADRIPQLIRDDEITELWHEQNQTVAVYFAKQTYRSITKQMDPGVVRKMGEIPTDEEFLRMVMSILMHAGGERITSITGTTRARAVSIILSSLERSSREGLGTAYMSQILRDDLKNVWDNVSTYMASRIARTETAAASNLGSLAGAKKFGEPMLKVWLSTRDPRTRRRSNSGWEHYGKYPSGPDGEAVGLDEKFTKTGEKLDYPGDYSGSAGNVIHCRCTQYYEPIEDHGTVKPPTGSTEPPK